MRFTPGGLVLAMMLGACASAPVVPPSQGAAPPQPAPSVAGTRWVGQGGSAEDAQSRPRLEFAAGGELHGYTGCNMLSGRWTEAEGEVHFSKLIVTKRYCLGPGAEIEKRLLESLSGESRARREGASLIVTSPQGVRYEFTAAAAA